MASFTEQATLKVIDQSTAQINKINAALRRLDATARKLKSTRINFDVAGKGLSKTSQDVRRVIADLGKLKSASGAIKINVNAAGLSAAQRQLQQLRTQAQHPISITTAARAGAGRQQGVGGAGVGGVGRGGPLQIVGTVAVSNLAALAGHLLHAVGRATVEGVNASSIADASLRMKQLSERDYTAAQQAIRELGQQQAARPGGSLYNTAQRQQLFSEALGVTSDNVEAAKKLTGHMEELTRTSVALGQGFEQAQENAISYGKAAEQLGRTTFHDPEAARAAGKQVGDFNVTATGDFFEYMQKLQPSIGREMTGTFVRQMAKYLGAGKQSISNEAFGKVLMLGEEEGTRAAVGYRQAVRQLSGQRVQKAQLANLEEAGLVTTKEVKAGGITGGKRKKGITTTAVADPGTPEQKDYQRLLKTDMFAAVDKYIAPQAQKFGLDLTNAGDAYTLAGKFTSDTTAQEALATALYRRAELAQKAAAVEKRSGKEDFIRKQTAGDVRTTVAALGNQLQSVTGEAVMAIAPVFTPMAQAMSGVMQEAGEAIKASGVPDQMRALADKKDPASQAKAVALGTAAAAGVATAMKPFLPAVGTVSGMQAMASNNPAIRSLGAAGVSLNTAGGELSIAAAAFKGLPAMLAFEIAKFVSGGSLGSEVPDELKNPTAEDRARIYARDAAKYELDLAKRKLADYDSGQAPPVPPGKSTGSAVRDAMADVVRAAEQRARLQDDVDRRQREADRLSKPGALVSGIVPQVTKAITDALKAPAPGRAATDLVKAPPAGDAKWGDPTKPSSMTDIATAAQTMQGASSAFSASFLQGTSELSTTASNFSSVFSQGAVTIGGAGNQIVGTLQGAAGGIGAIIGNTAAEALRAAASSIAITVNATVNNNGSDKGNINNANGNK
ncbi:hypothetical protein ACT4MK_18205 [Bradyrhizobium barranii]|uniref:hypothetical protein n=1 Tax=Bradyrhizobium barranii TaxID=2992140 RepID=UPI004033ABB0